MKYSKQRWEKIFWNFEERWEICCKNTF